MNFRILKPAEIELDEAFIYYEEKQTGLGFEFADDIIEIFKRIQANPEAWSPFSKHTRRCLANKFPFGVIYQISENELLIVAVANLHKKPGFWEGSI